VDQPSEAIAVMELSAVFTLLFVMLGPIKILGPFAQLTRQADEKVTRQIAVRAFAIAVIAVVAGGFIGRALVFKWGVSIPALLLAGAIVFFLVGLRLVLEQYEPSTAAPAPLPAAPMAAAMRIAFPTVVTPYGVAAVIVLLASTQDSTRIAGIVGITIAIMALNLLAMLYARSILRGPAVIALSILGAVLGVLQVGLAVELALRALRALGVLEL
jgi:multiple antibiotic resistance protein